MKSDNKKKNEGINVGRIEVNIQNVGHIVGHKSLVQRFLVVRSKNICLI